MPPSTRLRSRNARLRANASPQAWTDANNRTLPNTLASLRADYPGIQVQAVLRKLWELIDQEPGVTTTIGDVPEAPHMRDGNPAKKPRLQIRYKGHGHDFQFDNDAY